jgi:1-deoxy-D-xylulose-5-phosphate reductoisomerase
VCSSDLVLGSTGSIGESALRVAEALPSRIRIVGLAVHRSYKRVLEQARQFQVSHIAVADPAAARLCAAEAPAGIHIHEGARGIDEVAALEEADIVLCALVGMAGLKPVMAALGKGKDVALATKEVLVAAGAMVTETAARHGGRILPVDSEHSAVFQCLEGRGQGPGVRCQVSEVKRILLTASGGPFALKPDIDFDKVTVSEALRHPRWNMGKKVTVDSATLMNKGLEIMEAHWLFGVPVEKIDVVVHPESIVHSMVEFVDGSVLAQLSLPDMRFAIQYALTYPERVDGHLPALDLATMGPLHFKEPDEKRFPCLRLAREAARAGGTMPAVLNAANEIAVQKFLDGKTTFSGVGRLVESVMAQHRIRTKPDLNDILEADAWARKVAEA